MTHCTAAGCDVSADYPVGEWWFVGTNFKVLAFAIMFYMLLIRQLEESFLHRKGLSLQKFLIFHNLFSLSFSFAINVGILWGLFCAARDGAIQSFTQIFCDPEGRLWPYFAFWVHAFYLSKYYELVDTVILALRKKPISFLHFFHHSSYIFACFGCSISGLTMQFYPALWNSFVHVVMYSYYALMVTRHKRRFHGFAKRVTQLQMIQFVVGNITYVVIATEIYVFKAKCHGDFSWMTFQSLMTIAFLKLFWDMFRGRYRRRRSQDRGTGKIGKTE